ncbi:MAG: hypoxanthine phosphoribosyltransferase [Candidatus Methylomirabilia bacterium]
MGHRVGRVLITAEEIAKRIQELGGAVTHDYAEKDPVVVGVLQGAVVFLGDLIRATNIPITVDFITLSSYGVSTGSSGVVKITSDLAVSIENRHVLIVEDIVDTGHTSHYLRRNLESRRPASLRLCALLDKAGRRKMEVEIDYVGFSIPNEFVVGYGLDFMALYRNLPYIAVLEAEPVGPEESGLECRRPLQGDGREPA